MRANAVQPPPRALQPRRTVRVAGRGRLASIEGLRRRALAARAGATDDEHGMAVLTVRAVGHSSLRVQGGRRMHGMRHAARGMRLASFA